MLSQRDSVRGLQMALEEEGGLDWKAEMLHSVSKLYLQNFKVSNQNLNLVYLGIVAHTSVVTATQKADPGGSQIYGQP